MRFFPLIFKPCEYAMHLSEDVAESQSSKHQIRPNSPQYACIDRGPKSFRASMSERVGCTPRGRETNLPTVCLTAPLVPWVPSHSLILLN